jgi:FkbM family methyltransferase
LRGKKLLISVEELQRKFGVCPSGILHVGAHLAEESQDYERAGWAKLSRVIWIESQPDLAKKLSRSLDPNRNKVINATVWSESGKEMKFNVANNSQSSSLLSLGTHAETYPNIKFESELTVTTKRLDEIIDDCDDISFVNLDIQGAELDALKGLGLMIHKVKWIYSEVNQKEVYEGCAKINELDDYLAKFSFERIATRWAYGTGWGDALWIKESESKGLRKSITIFKLNEVRRVMKIFWGLRKHQIKSGIQKKLKPTA